MLASPGLLIQIHKGGEWVELEGYGEAIKVAGEHLFVTGKTYRRIANGNEDNLLHFYQTISYA